MEIYTPGYWKKQDSALREKNYAIQTMSGVGVAAPWVNIADLAEINRINPEAHPMAVPVHWPNMGWIGDYWIGYGFKPRVQGGAINTYDGIIAARQSSLAQDFTGFKIPTARSAPGVWAHNFGMPGVPSSATAPTSAGGSSLTRNSSGAWPLRNPATTTPGTYVLTAGVFANFGPGIHGLMDLIWQSTADNLATTGVTIVNSTTPLRYESTVTTAANFAGGNMVFAEVISSIGAAAASSYLLSSYVDQGGNVSSATVGILASSITLAGQIIPNGQLFVPLASGDFGVLALNEVDQQGVASTGTVSFYISRPILFIPQPTTSIWVERETATQLSALFQLDLGSDNNLGCLSWVQYNVSSVAGAIVTYQTRITEG